LVELVYEEVIWIRMAILVWAVKVIVVDYAVGPPLFSVDL
jgi:hypothetical protein